MKTKAWSTTGSLTLRFDMFLSLCISAIVAFASARPHDTSDKISLAHGTILSPGDAEQGSYYRFGPTWGWRHPAPYPAYVMEVETTLIPGAPPNPKKMRLAIWPGMDTSDESLLQPVAVASINDQFGARCANASQWCAFASQFVRNGGNRIPVQKFGKFFALDAATPMTWRVKYHPSNGSYTQDVLTGGVVRSTLTYKSAKGIGYMVSNEAQGSFSGHVNAQSYHNTTIKLDKKVPKWGTKIHFRSGGACASSVTTPDGGLTWKVGRISIPEHNAPQDYQSLRSSGTGICTR